MKKFLKFSILLSVLCLTICAFSVKSYAYQLIKTVSTTYKGQAAEKRTYLVEVGQDYTGDWVYAYSDFIYVDDEPTGNGSNEYYKWVINNSYHYELKSGCHMPQTDTIYDYIPGDDGGIEKVVCDYRYLFNKVPGAFTVVGYDGNPPSGSSGHSSGSKHYSYSGGTKHSGSSSKSSTKSTSNIGSVGSSKSTGSKVDMSDVSMDVNLSYSNDGYIEDMTLTPIIGKHNVKLVIVYVTMSNKDDMNNYRIISGYSVIYQATKEGSYNVFYKIWTTDGGYKAGRVGPYTVVKKDQGTYNPEMATFASQVKLTWWQKIWKFIAGIFGVKYNG